MSERETRWSIDGLDYAESMVLSYPANNCHFSAGLVQGHPHDSVYLRMERDNDPGREVFILLRPDEMAAIVAVCGAALRDAINADDRDDALWDAGLTIGLQERTIEDLETENDRLAAEIKRMEGKDV